MSRPLVLFAEHDFTKRALTIARLTALGCDMADAWNRADCLARVEALRPDVVLIGATMAAEDGFALCRELRHRPSTRRTPMIVVIPAGERESASEARGAGATETIGEPIDFGILGDRIRDLVSSAGASPGTAQTRQSSGIAEQVARLGYWELDVTEQRFECSLACQAILGLSPGPSTRSLEEFIGCVPSLERGSVTEWLHTVIDSGETDYLGHHVEAPDGTERFVLEHAEPVTADAGRTVKLRGTVQDITKMRSGKTSILRLAYYDALTDLPNRRSFEEKLRQEFGAFRSEQQKFGLLFLDIDDFKAINDQYGHGIGDQVLQTVAKRISHVLRETDVIGRNTAQDLQRVARLGGDEFTVLLSTLNDPQDAGDVAQRLIASIRRPIRLDRHEFQVSTSVGIAICPEHGTDPETLVEHADRAMYAAKLGGKNNFRYYHSDLRPKAGEALASPQIADRRSASGSTKAAKTPLDEKPPEPGPDELLRLRAETQRLQAEREILMRAAALMAKEFLGFSAQPPEDANQAGPPTRVDVGKPWTFVTK